MADIISHEPQVTNPDRVPKAEVQKWLETGKPYYSPLFIGTSIRRLGALLKYGELPPTIKQYEWQHGLSNTQPNLYYLSPQTSELSELSIEFAVEYKQNLRLKGENLNQTQLETTAKNYAFGNSIKDGFYTATNFKTDADNLEFLAYRYFPDKIKNDNYLKKQFSEYTAESNLPQDQIFLNQIMEEADKIEEVLGVETCMKVLSKLIDRRGFLIYFNYNLLRNNDATPHLGFEDDQEIMLTTKNPLSTKDIAGLVPLSELDRTDLEDLLNS